MLFKNENLGTDTRTCFGSHCMFGHMSCWALNLSTFITRFCFPCKILPSLWPLHNHRDVTPTSMLYLKLKPTVRFYTLSVVILPCLTLLCLFIGHYWAEEAEPCWIQALPLWEQWPTPSDSHEHLQGQWRSGETTSGQSGILVAPQPRGARLRDAALADLAQLWPRGGGVQRQRWRRPQQGVQRELGQGGQRAWRREGASEEEQGHWLQARPPEGAVWEAQAAQRLRAHLRDVWDRCHGDRDGTVMGGLH